MYTVYRKPERVASYENMPQPKEKSKVDGENVRTTGPISMGSHCLWIALTSYVTILALSRK